MRAKSYTEPPAMRIGLTKEAEYAGTRGLRMRARLASTVMLSAVVFFLVAVLASVGVLWWGGDVPVGIAIGGICGTAAAFAFGAVVGAMGRSGGRSGGEHERSPDGHKR